MSQFLYDNNGNVAIAIPWFFPENSQAKHRTEFSLSQPFPKQDLVFTYLQYKSFENTVGKRHMLEMSNFSFFHSFFYPFEELSALFIRFELLSANSFSL